MAVKAKCKNCGKEAPAEQFKLHYQIKMMVCPDCFSGKTQKQQEMKKAEPVRPAGWDLEDDYLQKHQRMKEKEKPQFKRIPGTDQVECTCRGCKFAFKYDPFRKKPRTCPFCNENIPRLNTFSLL